MIPADHLPAVWRCEPNHGTGVFTVGLDPREARAVLLRGWATLDGVRYHVTDEGCYPGVQGDGRVMVRCIIENLDLVDHLTRPRLRLIEDVA